MHNPNNLTIGVLLSVIINEDGTQRTLQPFPFAAAPVRGGVYGKRGSVASALPTGRYGQPCLKPEAPRCVIARRAQRERCCRVSVIKGGAGVIAWIEPVSKNIYYEGISFVADQFHDRNEHTRHSRDQPGQRPDTCQIVSTAGAAVWLPHAKLRDTRMMSEQGNQSSA